MKKKQITQKIVRKLFVYDPNTGNLINRIDRSSNAKKGALAGCIGKEGYRSINVDRICHSAHRLIFLYHHDYLPEKIVSHLDRNKLNNRIENLKEVSKSCAKRNSVKQSNNTSGVTGVHYRKSNGKWRAYLEVNGKRQNIGTYENFDNAVLARFHAEQIHNENGCFNDSPAEIYLERKTTS